MARDSDPETLAAVITWAYSHAITYGALRVDESVVRAITAAAQAAEGSNDVAVSIVNYTLGVALLSSDAADDRDRGQKIMWQARDNFLRIGTPFLVPLAELCSSREEFRVGDRDAAISRMRNAVGELQRAGRFGYGVWGTGILAEALLERGAAGDLAETQELMGWLERLPGSEDWAIHAVTLLRLRALQARARADPAHRELVGRYRALAEAHGYGGHIAWAQAMDGGER
jgi:hypothetical protein